MLRAIIIVLFLAVSASIRAQIAGDNAQNYPTTVGSGVWNDGDNFGFGFEPWQFVVTGSAGMFLGDSTQNGGAGLGDAFSSGGINSPNNRAWGVFANNGGTADAIRPFQSALAVGQTFSVDFDNGFIDAGSSDGVILASTTGTVLWEFLFTGGQSAYQIFDSRGLVNTTLPFTDDGMHIEFLLTSPTSYTFFIQQAAGPAAIISGNLAAAGAIGQFAFFDHNAGFNSSNNVYANSLEIIPEPSTFSLVTGSLMIAATFFLRRNR